MKTFKRWFALCLALVTVFSAMTVSAAAEDAAEQPASRFLTDRYGLYAIDLSDKIRDFSTVNDGLLSLQNEERFIYMAAKFVPQYPGVVVLGWYDEDDGFTEEPMRFYGTDYTFTLSADEGNLFDDVASFSFTVKEVFDSAVDDMKVHLLFPSITVGEMDGDLVKTLIMNVRPDWTECDSLLESVDMTKEVKLTVDYYGARNDLRAVPVSFDRDSGDLTLALYNGDQAGVALHYLNISFNDTDITLYGDPDFDFLIPEGLFIFSGSVVNEEMLYDGATIENMPMLSVLDFHLSERTLGFLRKIGSSKLVQNLSQNALVRKILASKVGRILLAGPVLMFISPLLFRLIRVVRKSYIMYGFDFDALLREELRSGSWLNTLRSLFG